MYDNKKIQAIKTWLGNGSINIFGRPFAGKDNQAKILIDIFGGNLIGGGDILRDKNMPEYIKQYMRTGQLIPTEDYKNIVLPILNLSKYKNSPLFLSSLGRWRGEEESVINALELSDHPLKAVLYLDIPESESFKRWEKRDVNNDRGERHDDTKEILAIRLDEFAEKTLPVIDFYKTNNLLVTVNGEKPRQEVTSNIIEALYNKIA